MTPTQKQLAESARKLHYEADYLKAFDTLLEGGSSFFIYFLTKLDTKDSWITAKAPCAKYFWNDYLLKLV